MSESKTHFAQLLDLPTGYFSHTHTHTHKGKINIRKNGENQQKCLYTYKLFPLCLFCLFWLIKHYLLIFTLFRVNGFMQILIFSEITFIIIFLLALGTCRIFSMDQSHRILLFCPTHHTSLRFFEPFSCDITILLHVLSFSNT